MKMHRMAVSGVMLLVSGPFVLQGCMQDALEAGNNPSAAGMSGAGTSAAGTSGGGREASSSGGAEGGAGGTAARAGAAARGGADNGGEVAGVAGANEVGADCNTLMAEHVTEYEEATTCNPNALMDECGATYKPITGDQCTIAVNAGATDAVARLHDIELDIQTRHCSQPTLGACAPGTTGHCSSMGRCVLALAN